MRSDHLAKHVKTHNGNPSKKGSSESCSDSEEVNHNDNNNTQQHGQQTHLDHQQHPQQQNQQTNATHPHQQQHMQPQAPQHHHHPLSMVHQMHHTSSPGIDHSDQLDVKPGLVWETVASDFMNWLRWFYVWVEL